MKEEEWVRLIGGGFAGMKASFALHPQDKKRARVYLQEAKKQNLTVSDALRHARSYLENAQGWPCDIDEQLEKVRKYFTGKLNA